MDRRTVWIIWIYLTIEYLVMVIPVDTDDRWSSWSAWSECSRACNGGASYQLRQCKDSACAGDGIRYRTCNTEPCSSGVADFRIQQCQAYNDVPYLGKLYKWRPYYDVTDPCSLQCTADGHDFRVALAPKVLDGTRCYPGSRDMCINGKCRTVGCDHLLESTRQEDDCGVCGGDGTSCANIRHKQTKGQRSPVFVWHQSDFSSCSVSCGVGEQVSEPTCVDSMTGGSVYPLYCDRLTKPVRRMRVCTQPSCHPTWITAEWRHCSQSCGGGLTTRNVYCVRVMADGTFTPSGETCADKKPRTQKYCNTFGCPTWVAGGWAPCSVTCGSGHQTREVICRPTKTHACSLTDRPPTQQTCDTGFTCVKPKKKKVPTATLR